MEDKHYDVFIAGILPEKQHQTEQVEAAFLAHYAGRYHHYKKALQQPGEYCFAKGVSLEQAEEFQKKLLHIGLLSRYRPAIAHDISFQLEPLPEQTITCPFCQHRQKKPEKLTGQRCENCKAKMSLFEKRWRMLEKAKAKPPEPIRPTAPVEHDDALPLAEAIEQARQHQQSSQRQAYFYSGLILFTLTAILGITGFALYQYGLELQHAPNTEKSLPAPPQPSPQNPVTTNEPAILQQGLNIKVLSELSADQLLKTASQLKPDTKLPDLNKISASELSKPQLEAALTQLQQSAPAIDPDNLAQHIAALDKNAENALPQTKAQQFIEQVKQASPEQRQRIRQQLEQNLPVTADTENAVDIFAPLYAMEKFKSASKQRQQRLKKLYRSYLQDKLIAKRLQHFLPQPSPLPISTGWPRKTHAPTPLDKSLSRWLHPQLADILLNQHFDPIDKS